MSELLKIFRTFEIFAIKNKYLFVSLDNPKHIFFNIFFPKTTMFKKEFLTSNDIFLMKRMNLKKKSFINIGALD